ncbi:MAG TPA: hypothetical protein VF505_04970, partial [Thermoanaerobaculia bacterium]
AAFNNTGTGFVAQSTGTAVDMILERCRASGNNRGILAGVAANQFAAVVRVSNSTITNCTIGVEQTGGGAISSRVNNTLEHNGSGNTFSTTFSAK